MSDGGFVISCGAGIEECGEVSDDTALSNCKAGIGDTRPGAVPRGPGVWNSLVVRVDVDGNLLWQRVDSYKDSDSTDAEMSAGEGCSSAAEWVMATSDGGVAVVTDETFGVGLLRLSD